MTELMRLVDTPGSHSLPYIDPAFPDRPLVLHAARPREYQAATPIVFVHHGVNRNGREYRDYWLDLVDEAGIGNLHRIPGGVVPGIPLVPFR